MSAPAAASDRGVDAVVLSAQGQRAAARTGTARQQPQRTRAYGYIEFIAREDPPTGHAYVRYGRLDAAGRPLQVRYAGLYPRYGWAGKIAGSFIPMESDTGRHPEDIDSLTVVNFRRELTQDQFARIDAQVRATQARPAHWHALFFNCNEYVGTLARMIGLATPISSFLPSAVYVSGIQMMNTAPQHAPHSEHMP